MCQPVTTAPALLVVAEAVTLKVSGTVAPLAGLLTVTVTDAEAADASSRNAISVRPSADRMDLGCVCMWVILSKGWRVLQRGDQHTFVSLYREDLSIPRATRDVSIVVHI